MQVATHYPEVQVGSIVGVVVPTHVPVNYKERGPVTRMGMSSAQEACLVSGVVVKLKTKGAVDRASVTTQGRRNADFPALNMSELARQCDSSTGHMNNIFLGRRRASPGLAEKIAQFTGIKVRVLNKMYQGRGEQKKHARGNGNGGSNGGSNGNGNGSVNVDVSVGYSRGNGKPGSKRVRQVIEQL